MDVMAQITEDLEYIARHSRGRGKQFASGGLSFVECAESLFDDNGLADALAVGQVFDPALDRLLIELNLAMRSMLLDRKAFRETSLMPIRKLAQSILQLLKSKS